MRYGNAFEKGTSHYRDKRRVKRVARQHQSPLKKQEEDQQRKHEPVAPKKRRWLLVFSLF